MDQAVTCLTVHFILVLNSSFLQVLSSIRSFPVSLTDQLEHLTVRCVVGSGVSNVDNCGRLSQPSWLLGAL